MGPTVNHGVARNGSRTFTTVAGVRDRWSFGAGTLDADAYASGRIELPRDARLAADGRALNYVLLRADEPLALPLYGDGRFYVRPDAFPAGEDAVRLRLARTRGVTLGPWFQVRRGEHGTRS